MNRKEFRQALSHAVDREAFADAVFLGTAVPIHGPITPGNKDWFWPSHPRYEFSREKARALLEGLGLTNRDQDEWLEDERGHEARFTALVFRGNTVLERSASVVREDLRQIGVAIDIVTLEPNSVGQRVVDGPPQRLAEIEVAGEHRHEDIGSPVVVQRRSRPRGSSRCST